MVRKSEEFKKRAVYQIYPASFCDSNNDGFGDIKGIISKLDYLKNLGIGIIWLSPIYDSPMDDMGYDISDYYKINPRFGTMSDFDELVKEAKERDILIVMDLVVNHTSTEHHWFKSAISSPTSPYRDYYIIREGNGKKPPNNWDSAFSGSAWKRINDSSDFYMHLFCDTQADLNFNNPKVIEEVKNILRFYLEKGVYGFRCDVINYIYKSSLKNDSPLKIFGKGRKYYLNQDGFYDVMREIREDVLDQYDCFLVGETGFISVREGMKMLQTRALDMFFEFDHATCDKLSFLPVFPVRYKPKKLMKSLFEWQNPIPWIGVYLENHDQVRSVNRFGNTGKYYKESAKMLAALLLTLKGTSFIYQGQEFGMLNYENHPLEKTNDIAAKMVFSTMRKVLPFLREETVRFYVNEINRDHARIPLAWSNSTNGGFNEGAISWLPVNPLYKVGINASASEKDETSIFNFYKKLLMFKNRDDVLLYGEFVPLKVSNTVNIFERRFRGKTHRIVLNMSEKSVKYNERLKSVVLISNYELEPTGKTLLPPYFVSISEISR